MANYFDKYDGATGGNYFDKYDAPAPAPETLAPKPPKPSLGARAFNAVNDIGTPAPSPHNLADLSTPNNGSSLTRRLIGDPAVSLAKGAVGTGEAAIGLLDIPSLGRAGQDTESFGVDFKRTQGILEKAYSPEQQAANEAVSNAKGFLPTIGATVQNPSTIPNKIVESLPQMAGGLAIGKGAAMLAPKISPLLAGAFGEGAITAGSQAEGIRQESKDGLLTPGQTALALGSGALTGAITGGAGALANKLGITDINQLLLGQKATGKTPGLAARTLEGGLTEGAQETVQSSQEQAATNLALDKPIGEGVGNAAALGLLTGGVMGGGVSAISRPDISPSTQLDLGGKTIADLPSPDPISTAIKAGETATEESAPASPPTHVDAEGNGYYPTTNPNLFRDSDGKLIQNKGNIFYASSPVVGQPETAVIDKLDAFANTLEGNNAETETPTISGEQQATGQAATDQAPGINAPEPALQQNAPTQSPTHIDNNGNTYRATEEPYTFVAEDGSEWIDESGTLITPIQDTKNAELGSRRSFASSNTTDINAISSKSTPDGLIVHAKSLGDVINSKPFIEHGYAGLDAPTRRVMLESMSALIQNNQISDDIVKLIPVDVMNNLTREEVAPDGLLHNKSMLKDLLPSDVNQPISTESNAAITELARNIASNSAKPISSFGSRSKIDSTGNASSQIAIGAGDASTSSVTKDKSRNRPGNNAFGFGDDSSTSPTTNGDGSAVVQTEPATKVPFFDVAKLSKKTNPAGATIDNRHDVTPSSDVGLGGDEVRASSSPSILPQPTKDQGTGFLQPINAVGSNKPKPNKPTGTQQDVFTPPEQANSLANKQALADLERQKDLKRQGAAKDGGELFGDHAGLVGQQDLADIVKSDKKSSLLQTVADIKTPHVQKDPSLPVTTGVNARLIVISKPEGAKYSKTNPQTTGSTVESVKAMLSPRLMKMLGDGRLVIEQSNAQEPTAEGYVKGGIVHLVADNLNKDNFSPVMQHELVHAAIRNDPKVKAAYEKFKGKLQARFNLAAKGIGTQAEISAYQRVISAETHPEHQVEEFAAYLVSIHNEKPQSLSATVRKAIADFIASIRAFLLRSGFTLKEITAADLNALAQYAITAKVGNGKSAAKTNAMASAKAQRFYSALNRAFVNAPEKVFGNGKQVAAWLQGNASKLGVKADEIYFSGIADYLAMAGKVSRDDVLSYLKSGGVQVEDVMLGDQSILDKATTKAQNAYYDWNEALLSGAPEEELKRLGDIFKKAESEAKKLRDSGLSSKYAQYTVPGGEPGTYQELLLTLPVKPLTVKENAQKGYWNIIDGDGNIINTVMADSLEKAKARSKDYLPKNSYKSSHFDQPNIVAHSRFDERTDADGNKTLFVMELQSDWSAEGRKQGFTQELSKADTLELENLRKQNQDLYEQIKAKVKRDEDADRLMSERSLILERIDELKKKEITGIPRAPFVEDTKAYINLLIKKLISHAVDNSIDKIAFINGEQAADLYDLRKQVDTISYVKNKAGDSVSIRATKDNRHIFDRANTPISELPDIVGKEVAEKIANDEGELNFKSGYTELSGLDLATGGTGMATFYNEIVPSVAREIAKRMGGEVGPVEVRGEKTRDAQGIPSQRGQLMSQTALTITPAMKAKVELEGLALFSRAEPRDALNPTIKEAKAILDWVDNGEPIALIKGDEVPRFSHYKELFAWINKEWHKGLPDGTKREINRPDVGNIRIDLQSVRDSSAHGLNRNKVQAFYIVPEVIKNGKILGELPRQQGKLAAFLIAAPVSIDGKKYKMYVEVRHDINLKRMYVHEVVLNDPATAFKSAAEVPEGSKLHSADRGAIYNFIRDLRNVKLDDSIKYSKAAPRDALGEVKRKATDFVSGRDRNVTKLGDIDKILATGKMPNQKPSYQDIKDKVSETLFDSSRPFDAWTRQLPNQVLAGEMILAKDRAKRRAADFEKTVVDNYLTPLAKVVGDLAKEHKLDYRAAKELVGQWLTVRYALEKNQDYIRQDQSAVDEAQANLDEKLAEDKKLLAEGKLDIQPTNVALKTALAKAKDHQAKRLTAINEDKIVDPTLEQLDVGLAGGYNDKTAQHYLDAIGDKLGETRLKEAGSHVYSLLAWKLGQDLKNGKVTKEIVDKWFNSPVYVPLTGDPMADEDEDPLFQHGSLNQQSDKKAEGRMASIAQNGIDAAIEATQKSARYHGWVDFKDKLSEMYSEMVQEGMDNGLKPQEIASEIKDKYGMAVSRETALTRTSDSGIIIRKGGKSLVIDLGDKKAVEALKNHNREEIPSLLQPVAFFTRSYGRLVTQFLPGFGAVNAIRDTWERSENIRTRTLPGYENLDMDKVARNALKEAADPRLVKKLMGVMSEHTPLAGKFTVDDTDPDILVIREMIGEGATGTVGDYLSNTGKDLSKQMETSLKLGHKAVQVISAWNNAFELVSTFSIYKSLRDAGVDKKVAASGTLNLMNFGKQGTAVGPLKALYVFANPALIGGHQLIQTMGTRKGQARAAAYMVAGMALYAMLRAADGDDDELGVSKMDHLSNFVVERNIPIPLGDGDYLKIPVGFGMPQLVWSSASNLVKYMSGSQTAYDTGAEIMKSMVKSIAPVQPSETIISKQPLVWLTQTFTPQAAKPLANIAMNVNTFGGELTNSKYKKQGVSPALQGKDSTAEFYKDVSETLAKTFGVQMYPEQVKELVKGYFAVGPGSEIVKALVENPNKKELGRDSATQAFDRFIAHNDSGDLKERLYYAARADMSQAQEKLSLGKELDPKEKKLAELGKIVAKLEGSSRGKLGAAAKFKGTPAEKAYRAQSEKIRDRTMTYTLNAVGRL